MSELGRDFPMPEYKLRNAFEAAQKAGDDFLFIMRYYTEGFPDTPAGFAVQLDSHEDALAINIDNYRETLRDYLTEKWSAMLVEAYDLRQSFDAAQIDVKTARTLIDDIQRDLETEILMQERPLWRKVLHLGPAGGS